MIFYGSLKNEIFERKNQVVTNLLVSRVILEMREDANESYVKVNVCCQTIRMSKQFQTQNRTLREISATQPAKYVHGGLHIYKCDRRSLCARICFNCSFPANTVNDTPVHYHIRIGTPKTYSLCDIRVLFAG